MLPRSIPWLLVAGLLGGCGDGSSPADTAPAVGAVPAKNAVLVSIDTTRADHVGAYGLRDVSTPVIDQLASRGVLFERAYATAPITLPSHASMLTGAYPCAHGVRDNGIFELGEPARSIAEAARESGLRTGGFVAAYVLDAKYGIGQGFEHWTGPVAAAAGLTSDIVERPANEVVDDALAWLETLSSAERFFLFVHFYDPHEPHVAQPGYPERHGSGTAYGGEIAFADEQLGRLLDGIEQRHGAEDLAVIVTADHGESLKEHAEPTHGIFLYDSTMRVPLIVRAPGLSPQRVGSVVSIADIPVTLLELLGLDCGLLAPVRGVSLLSPQEDRAVYLETLLPLHSYGWHPFQGVVWRDRKYILSTRAEFYDLTQDGAELQDLAAEQNEQADAYGRRLQALLTEHSDLGWSGRRGLDPEDEERLRALGYLSTESSGSTWSPDLPHPGDRIGDLDKRTRARELMREGRTLLGQDDYLAGRDQQLSASERDRRSALGRQRLSEAATLLRELVENNPADRGLDDLLGALEVSRGEYALAIEPLERVAAAQPGAFTCRYNLAISYFQTGQRDWARLEMEKAVTIERSFVLGYRWLIQMHAKNGEFGRALFWVEQIAQQPGLAQQAGPILAGRGRLEGLARERGQTMDPAPNYPHEDVIPEGLRE